jgi:hypothetical protein
MQLCATQVGAWTRQAEAERCPPRALWIMATGANMPAVDCVVAPAAAPAPTPALSPFMEALLTTWRRTRGLPAAQLATRFAETYVRSGAASATRAFGTEVLPLDPPTWDAPAEPAVRNLLHDLSLAT